MKRHLRIAAALSALCLPASAQTTHTVNLSSFAFDTPNSTIALGDTVQWVWVAGFHNVESGAGGTADGNFTSGDPVQTPASFSVTFDADFLAGHTMPNGLYPYYCIVHVGFAMFGTVKVNAPLLVSSTQISLAAGGSQTLLLDAGAAHANQLYWMFGTTAGFSPGIGGLPLNLSDILLLSINNPNLLIANGLDFLDASGQKSAVFALPAGLDPALAGVVFHHAYAVIDLLTPVPTTVLVSNAQSLTLVP